MKMRVRFSTILVIFGVLLLFGREVQAQTATVNNANLLYDALNDGTITTINLTGAVGNTLTDDDGEYLDFVSDPIENRIVTIKSNNRNIAYKSKIDDDQYEFYISVGTDGQLTFSDAANISGGYSSDVGVLFVDGGRLTFSGDANLHNNVGGVASSNAVISFQKLTMTDNTAADGGGALYLYESQTTIAGIAAFTKNYAGYDPEDYSFTSGNGGAINLYDGTLTFQNAATFGDINAAGTTATNGNQSADNGGALSLWGSDVDAATITFNNTASFGDNSSQFGSGGAIYLENATLTFDNTAKFLSNRVLDDNSYGGGALAMSGSVIHFKGNTDFQKNIVNSSDSGGGAIYADTNALITFAAGTTVTFNENKTLVNDNTMPSGGAVYLINVGDPSDDPVVYHWQSLGTANFTNNESITHGGAIYAEYSTLQFNVVTFTGNKSGYENNGTLGGGGGAIYSDGSKFLFTGDTNFENNSATTGSGGAVFALGSGTFDETDPVAGIHFQNGVTVSNNTASSGGAFYAEDSVILFEKTSNIDSNSATTNGGAFYLARQSMLHFSNNSNTIISENSATNGGAIFVDEGASSVLKLENNAKLTINAGTTTAKNDVYLNENATLTFNVSENGNVSIYSALASAESDAVLTKQGTGTVSFGGDGSGYSGELAIEEGEFRVITNNNWFGNLENTIITVEDGARLVVQVNDNSLAPEDGLGVIRTQSITLGDGGLVFAMDARPLSEGESQTGYALITIFDTYGNDTLQDYLDDGSIVSDSGLPLQSRIGSGTNDNGDEYYTLFVWTEYDPDDPNTMWVFNQNTGTLDLGNSGGETYTLDNTKTDVPTNATKSLTVNGSGLVKLSNADNKVQALEGNGNLEITKTLEVNGLQLNANDTKTYSGTLKGSGDFTKKGGYIQELTGSNSGYTGKMSVEAGTLRGNSDSLGNNIAISSGAVLEFKQDGIDNGTFSGTLTGNGNLLINGKVQSLGASDDSILTFTGNNSAFTGNTTVNTGWLVLDESSDFSQTDITVNDNGGFGGAGHVQSISVKEGGAIQAYQGTLTIDGKLEFEPNGKMYVFVEPEYAGNILRNKDYLEAGTGSKVDFTNATIEIVGIDANYSEGTVFQLTTGEVTGLDLSRKSQYTDNNNNLWEFTFKEDEDGNYVASGKIIGTGPSPPVVVTGMSWNQNQTASALKTAAVNPNVSQELKNFVTKLETYKTGTDANPVYDPLYLSTLKQLAGSVRANGLQLGLYSPYRTVFNRFSLGNEMYNGGAPIIYNNGYGPISGFQYRGAGIGETYRGQYDQVNPHTAETVACDVPSYWGENNFWVDVTHVQTKTKGDDNSPEYGISRTGLLIGLDIQRKPASRFGLLFGYFAPYLWQENDRVEADDYHAGLYLQKNYRGTDIYGYFGYAHQEYESRRFVDLNALNYGIHRYNGNTSGDSFSMSLELSRPRYYGNNFILRPLLGLDYLFTSQKGYNEQGNGDATDLFGLHYDRAQYDQLLVRLGMNLKRETFRSATNFRLQYINQFASNPYPDANARFLASPTADQMNIRGVNLGRDYLNVGFGLNVFINEARSRVISFDYDLNTSKRTTQHGLSLLFIEKY